MTHGSVFSGIGGPEVAAAMLGWRNVFHCEINPFGKQVLDYWFPDAESYEDITKTNFTKWRGKIDVLTGGFPCQPFSYAGKRAGAEDDRYLWPEMLRVINEVRPTWFVGENVNGIRTMVEQGVQTDLGGASSLFEEDNTIHRYELEGAFTIERICQNLESVGYSVQPFVIPAASVGAPHRRDRVFFVAYNTNGSNDSTKPGNADSTKGAQRLQERNDLRKPGEPDTVRPEMREAAENSLRNGCEFGKSQEQGSKRNERNVGTGDSERLYREKGTVAPDTDSDRGDEVDEHLQSKLANGDKSFCNGRLDAAPDTSCPGLQESLANRRGEEQEETGAGENNRTQRPDTCNNSRRNVADTDHARLERPHQSGSEEGSERMHLWRDIAGHDRQAWSLRCAELLPCNRWRSFPTVSPVFRGNDGFPFNVDNLTIPFAKWRQESLKAYGNAIVPQVMYEIFRAIESVNNK